MRIISDTRGLVSRGSHNVAIIGGAGILVISFIILVDILLRILFNNPIVGVTDITRYTFAVVIASFYPAGLVLGHNVTIKFLGRALGQRAELWLNAFGATITLGIVGMLAWKVYGFTIIMTKDGLTTMTLELPQAPWWWVVTVIFVLCVPVQLFVLIDHISQAVSGRPAEVPDTPSSE